MEACMTYSLAAKMNQAQPHDGLHAERDAGETHVGDSAHAAARSVRTRVLSTTERDSGDLSLLD